MRKFKFIGEASEYASCDQEVLQFGSVYSEDYIPWTDDGKPDDFWTTNKNVLDASKHYPQDWQEVFEEEKVQLTETEKIVLIDFLNDHFEEFWHFVGSSKTTDDNYWEILKEQTERYMVNEIVSSKEIVSNIIDKIEKL